ncbi:MAG: FecR domain-containing protein [Proteobacteria bacterium]|nr:FecR domain-containing protein [Pseudomonadota bacterium]
MRSVRLFAALVAVSVVFAPAAWAQQTEVGTTAAVNTDTTGTPPGMATRSLFIGANVFFEERIETSKSGQAQLLFLDESALTIASNSDVVLDKFIYDPKTSKGELALSIGAGVFRFVGGRISKTAGVTIKTPTATLGIRGGIVIIKVEPGTGATRATFVFGKEMTVTNKSGVTIRVTRPGFSVDVASQDDPPSSPFKVSGGVIASYLTELEGRTGQTAGLTEPLTDDQVADSGIDEVGSSTDPESIVTEETAATGGTDGGDPMIDVVIDPLPIDEIIDDGNVGGGEGTTTTSTATLFNSTFAGRFKTGSVADLTAGKGTTDGDPISEFEIDFDIEFSGASVVGGVLTVPTGGFPAAPTEALLLPTSGTPVLDVELGFTGFSFELTDTDSPFGELSGEGFISDDGTFIFYETFDNGVFRDIIFAGIPATTFPTSGITAYNMEADFALESLIPFIRGVSGGDLESGFKTVFDVPPAPAAIDWGNGVFGGALVAIDGQGTNQTSAATVFGGSVVTGTQATADLLGFMRGTARVVTDEQPHLFDSAIELSRDGDLNAFFGADNPDYFVFQSAGGATDDFDGIPTNSITYFPNVVAHVDTTETFGTRTTRTLNGFSGGAFQVIDVSGLLDSTSFFVTTTGDPGDVNIFTDAATGTLTATIDVFSSSEDRIVAEFGGAGVSAFFADDAFGAIESSSISTTVNGAPVDNALLYMVTDVLEEGGSGFLPAGVDFCLCEFLQWGFWGGDLELSSGDHLRIHLANWVAGELPALLDMPTTGTATYSGHAIGTVNNDGDIYQAVGGFSQTYDFAAEGVKTFSVTDFDTVSYSGDLFAGGAEFVGTGSDTGGSGRTIFLGGAFFSGGGDPVAQVGGSFSIDGPDYEASGIFAADQTSFTP